MNVTCLVAHQFFYYSHPVPKSVILKIDRKLGEIYTSGETLSILEHFIKNAYTNWGEPSRELGPALLFPFLIVTVALVLIIRSGVLLSRMTISILR